MSDSQIQDEISRINGMISFSNHRDTNEDLLSQMTYLAYQLSDASLKYSYLEMIERCRTDLNAFA